jgi:hypothetical protein
MLHLFSDGRDAAENVARFSCAARAWTAGTRPPGYRRQTQPAGFVAVSADIAS